MTKMIKDMTHLERARYCARHKPCSNCPLGEYHRLLWLSVFAGNVKESDFEKASQKEVEVDA